MQEGFHHVSASADLCDAEQQGAVLFVRNVVAVLLSGGFTVLILVESYRGPR